MRDGRAELRGREAYLTQSVDRLSGEPAQLAAWNRRPACRSGVSVVAVEALVNHAGEEGHDAKTR
jgi:hypothetical protein